MMCAWNELLNILPLWMRNDVNSVAKETLQELRLRLDMPAELVTAQGSKLLQRKISIKDLEFVVNTASAYSPWAATTSAYGYITAPGGHRIGLCGDVITDGRIMTGMRRVRSLCIRVARDFPGISKDLYKDRHSILILGPPGSGKTTLLRDLIRKYSENGVTVSVVDERGELFPATNGAYCFPIGNHTDVLTGVSKSIGLELLLRTMGPQAIAVDEITADADCGALIHASWCGVQLLATAHASAVADLKSRPVYRPLLQNGIFSKAVVLQPDKSWFTERISP